MVCFDPEEGSENPIIKIYDSYDNEIGKFPYIGLDTPKIGDKFYLIKMEE